MSEVQCKQPHPGFELGSLIPFLILISVTLSLTPYIYIYIYIYSVQRYEESMCVCETVSQQILYIKARFI